ncbi:DUF1549 and DUF1553 domain-containing protein [Gimesia fumaroli]|uniref:DUF1553 domain-containing protein n=1 Tax=Gimesia fumaroli TaxID=2527976 RepID=A0A518IDG2_9PLAN|nr:DUF1549 and DUF1553 domain-containing protein [Gimesia fumaroli]QDV51107.1 hypothetical protein Enr17x_31590 [Gimesia fumaroli]
MLLVFRHHHDRSWKSVSRYAIIAFSTLLLVTISAGPLFASGSPTKSQNDRLSDQIDDLIHQAQKRKGVVSAPLSTDAEFMRRISLDLTGKIPPVAELRLFLADQDPQKREKLINRLLATPGFIVHFTNTWRDILLPEAATDLQTRGQIPEFDAWLRSQLQENVHYDELVRKIINAPLAAARNRQTAAAQDPTPRAYYITKQLKPENLAAGTSRAFLGVRIECAQCHDHPFDDWKQHQFWQYAAFFSNIDQRQQNAVNTADVREVVGKPQIKIPDTNRLVDASFLDGIQPEWDKEQVNPRLRLSEWVVSSQNPYFAKASVNRIWSLFFGRGIVDPVDDFSSTNRASHPELLELLAHRFQEQHYDLKYLIREITNSQTYQLTSKQTNPSQSRVEWYGKMPTRRLTSEQIFANLVQATGFFQQTSDTNTLLVGPGVNTPQAEFYELFKSDSENQLEPKASILQALALMNGRFITNATSIEQSDVFTAIVEFPALSVEKKIEAFYLSTLSRFPTKSETARLTAYVSAETSAEERTHAYSDLFWALLNSSEFLLNH